MKKRIIAAIAIVAGIAQMMSAAGADMTATYYKVHPQFHPYPDEKAAIQSIDRLGPVGIGINLLQPAFKMQVKNVEPGSPAEATGKLKPRQLIDSINGRVLKDMDPRQILGDIIAKAEATDGKIVFVVRSSEESSTSRTGTLARPDAEAKDGRAGAPVPQKSEEVIVTIPVLGAYSKTWPLNDAKSDKIVRGLADFVAKNGGGNMGLGTLFLLSTGEEKDLEVVRGWMKKVVAENKDKKEMDAYPWYAGYGGLSLCEYYLRTGDESILHTIKLNADSLRRTQFNGAWGHKGLGIASYSLSGHLNAAGANCLTFLLLAKECGVDVDEGSLQSALKYFYKFAGHGNVAYGDGLPEGSFVDNGKTGILAFGLKAAAGLTPEGEKSVYARASDISAGKSFYSTSWMLHGHTGGGIGEIWRGAAMGLMREKQPQCYQSFMNDRAWFYDLSRRFDGSFGIIGGGRYDDPGDWGKGMGLVYTLPRKQLRIFGGPATKFCKTYQLPKRPWGTEADEAFYSLDAIPGRDGKTPDWDKVTLVEESSLPIAVKLGATNLTEETMLKYAHHPELGIREYAVGTMKKLNRTDLILELLKSKDPRGRHIGIFGISEVNDEIAGLLLGMVEDPNESWWVARCAMDKLGKVRAELILPHKDRLMVWLKHEDWWMNSAAMTALTSLIVDKEYAKEILPVIGEIITKQVRPSPMWGLEKMMRGAGPEAQALALQEVAQAYAKFPKVHTNAAGVKLSSATQVQVGNFAWLMSRLPNGFDVLYGVGKERFPGQGLPHQQLFLEANPEQFGKELRGDFQKIIREKVIPEYIGGYWMRKNLMDEAASVSFRSPPLMDDLVGFYQRIGVRDYDWHDFGPAINTMKWNYFSFDPPEKFKLGDFARYRKVTVQPGMENWFAKDFDPVKAGWKSGLQPIGQVNGKLGSIRQSCPFMFCRCTEPMQTLWEKEVLLVQGKLKAPKFKEGCRYRLVFGGMSDSNSGEGFEVYINGKQVIQRNNGVGRGRDGHPAFVYYLEKALWPEFESGAATIAAKGFLRVETNSTHNTMLMWLQEMKCPPMGEKEILESVKAVPMTSSAWQALQNPDNMELDPEQGKFWWDGTFVPNAKVVGAWTQITEVAKEEDFTPTAPLMPNPHMLTKLTFAANGRTDDPLVYYTGDTLMHLNTNQALKTSLKTIDGKDYLFIEAGGFGTKNGPAWKPRLLVMKQVGEKK